VNGRLRIAAARAGALYLVLYLFPAPLGGLPFVSSLAGGTQRLEAHAIAGLFSRISGHTISAASSFDSPANWLRLPCLMVIAAIAAMLWTWRRPSPSPRARVLFFVYLRVVLATTMIAFGAAKLLRVQFDEMPVFRLFVPVGEQSPMGLLWSFMGFSYGYCIFVGLAELGGGVLLLWSGSMAGGALILVAVLANVVAMDLAYDVPVKIEAIHDLLIALVLVAPSIPRVLAALRGPKARLRWVPFLLIAAAVVPKLNEKREMIAFDHAPCPLEGVWMVESFIQDGVSHPANLDDKTRWRRAAFFGSRFVANGMDEKMMLTANAEYSAGALKVVPDNDQAHPYLVAFVRDGDTATLDGHGLHVTLRSFDPKKARLNSRGFHWVSEDVYNY
jgi:hypothetical protein